VALPINAWFLSLATLMPTTKSSSDLRISHIIWQNCSRLIVEFLKFEKQLLAKVYDLGRLFISLFFVYMTDVLRVYP
jgi:hypothetical protein